MSHRVVVDSFCVALGRSDLFFYHFCFLHISIDKVNVLFFAHKCFITKRYTLIFHACAFALHGIMLGLMQQHHCSFLSSFQFPAIVFKIKRWKIPKKNRKLLTRRTHQFVTYFWFIFPFVVINFIGFVRSTFGLCIYAAHRNAAHISPALVI